MNDKNPTDMFRMQMDHAVNVHFPKGKCKERSAGLMLFATSVLQHEEVMCQVRSHLNHLLGADETKGPEYEKAKAFYLKLIE
jgi:hypothetical protein